MIHQMLSTEIRAKSTTELRLDWYDVVAENDCLVIVDRPECPAEKSSRRWPLSYILKSDVEGLDTEACVEKVASIIRLGWGSNP